MKPNIRKLDLITPGSRQCGRKHPWWQRISTAGLTAGLALFIQSVHASTVVLDDDFNDPGNNLGLNTLGIGGGFTAFSSNTDPNTYALETNGVVQLSGDVNGGSRASIASINPIGLGSGGTTFEFRNVKFANQPSNTGTGTTDRLLLGVENQAPAGDFLEAGPTAMPAGFWIQFNSDSEASGTCRGTAANAPLMPNKSSSANTFPFRSFIGSLSCASRQPAPARPTEPSSAPTPSFADKPRSSARS